MAESATLCDDRDSASRGAGIFPCQIIRQMMQFGEISATQDITDDQIQPASLDLRLGQYAYPVATSFLPGSGMTVMEKLRQLDEHFEDFKIPLDTDKGALLEKNRVYVIPLMESIKLKTDHVALANPKSSTGRLDILTRLIVDGATQFDEVADCYEGPLYIEVAPRSFSIVLKMGARLNQLRFQKQNEQASKQITDEEWKQLVASNQIVRGEKAALEKSRGTLPFHVDLLGSGKDGDLIGWRSKENAGRVDLERRDYDPLDYWEPLFFRKTPSLVLDPNRFYILMTKEAIGVPPDYAAEMMPYDTRAGEFRVHYAGFFDPGFGYDSALGQAGGSRGVLEVRSHEVPFQLEDGQLVGYLKYEKMAARPDTLYGATGMASNYQGQNLKLAKQFRGFTQKES